ncbi:MAG TPA: transcriptional repressor LexA [Candidatus Paceibacterota bacterium]|nr:transcriptional repressor LexA [Candidatus Paceibacterota bacterium]
MTPLQKIREFYETKRRMPSYQELMGLLGYRSKSAAHYAVKKLIAEGGIAKDKTGKLVPAKFDAGVPLLGVVEAGFPSAAEEELLDTMTLDEYLVTNKQATFMLHVKGDSMMDAGIMAGDLVLVERGRTPKHGDIVIAEVDGEYTMKYYRKSREKVWLEPANKRYKPIYPTAELKVEAIVTAVVRKY